MQGGGPATCRPGTRVRDGRGIVGGAGNPAHGSNGGPVDQIVEGIGQSLAHAGPEWAMIALEPKGLSVSDGYISAQGRATGFRSLRRAAADDRLPP